MNVQFVENMEYKHGKNQLEKRKRFIIILNVKTAKENGIKEHYIDVG